MEGIHGNDQGPEQGVDPALFSQTHEAYSKGSLAHGTGHDDERLRDLAQKGDRDGILRYRRHEPFDMPAESFLDCCFDNSCISNEEKLLIFVRGLMMEPPKQM